jgi:CubicO group peptidase (beta-lactamase class C family)
MSAARTSILLAGLGVLACMCALAQVPTPSATAATEEAPLANAEPPHTAPLAAEDLSAFLDGMLPAAMAAGDIAGATVVVVQDDHVLLTKAYGLSDVKKHTPVSASYTLFRPGSISKLFTWTAVMQLVEQGKLDLDTDVNQYLDFRVTGLGGKPITLRHLMTHTPGFEEGLKDLLIKDPKAMLSLETVMKANTPRAINPPGAVPAYSNYGAGLAGYIVQRTSGMPFEAYVEEKIFAPLQMSASTFRQPVPKSLQPRLSEGYIEASGEVVTFEYCPESPAGALSTTAPDMANFMLAHLNGGYLPTLGESSRILKPETVEKMHATANRPAQGIDAMALGFYEQNRNGYRAIAHGGDLIAFHSDLLLIPAARVGIFMSFNSIGRNRATYTLRTALTEGFMDRYFPRAQPLPAAPKVSDASKERAAEVASHTYELSRRAETNLFSLLYMTGQSGASVTEKGTLLFDALLGPNDKPREFEEVTPWMWREAHGEMRLAAVRNDDGSIRWMVPDGYGPIFVFQPVPGWRSKTWLQPVIVVSAAVVTLGSLIWLVGGVRRLVARWRKKSASAAGNAGAAVRSRWILGSRLAGLSALVFVLFLGTMLVMFSGNSLWILTSAAVPFVRLVQLAALLATIGAIVSVLAAAWSWSAGVDTRWRSVGRTLVALSCVALAYVAVMFHFLTPTLRY